MAPISWPSIGPRYFNPRSSKSPCGVRTSFNPFLMPCRVSYSASPTSRVRPAVVVDDDDDAAILRCRDVVERLPAHSAGQGAVTDDGDNGPPLPPQGERFRQP